MFVRDKLMVNTSKNHRDIEADGEWKPSLSPLPATPLLSEMSRKKLLVNDQTSPAAARGLSFEGEDDEEVGDKTPLISARSFGNDEDEILFSYEDKEEAKMGLLSNSHEHSSDDPTTVPIETTSPPKKKTPYKALPTKHLPKYRALYNFISYEDCHLAVEKGDILFAIPDLDGEPLTEDGWTYCMLEGNIELRGYVPDTFILFLSPDEEDMRNKYHIALVKPPKERLYDIKNTQLFKINTQLAKEQQEQQIENDKLLSKLPMMKHADIKSELIKRGLDVKGNLHVLTDRLKDELRDKGFEHGEIVDYLSEGGTRHRAVIIHSARSDPSILNRQPSLTDSSKVSTLPSVTAGEEGSIDLVASVNNGSQLNNQHGANDGNVEGGGSGLDPHNLAKNSLEEDEPENYEDYLKNRLNDDDEEARNRFNQFQNEFDENHSQNNRVHMQNSEEDMDNLRELLKARSRRPRSVGAHGRLLYPTGDWNLQFPGYNFDAEILFRQRGVEAFKYSPESDTKMDGTGVRVGSNYPATANIFHNCMVRNEASLQAAARFPSRMPTSSSRPSSAIDRPSARLSGNPLGRPYSAGTGLRAVRNELTPNRISIDGGPTRAASPASSFGPKGRYHNTLSQSWQPSSNNDLKLLYFDNNSKNSKNKAPRTISGSGGGYYGTPDHTFGGANSRQQQSIEFQSSIDHEVSASHHSASFLANFGVDGSNEGDPPAHVMPPSFWVYGAQVQEITPEALAAHTAQQENGGGSETAEAAGYGVNQVITIPSRVPHLLNSSTTDSSYDHSKPSLGLFDKKNAIPKNDFHHHPEFGSNSGNVGDSFVSQQTPQFTHEYAPQSNGAFRSSPTKKMKNKKSTNPTGHHHHKSPVKASKSHHHLKQDGPHGPFTDPRPRPKPDDIHLFPWRQKMWEAQERAQKKESKKYAATRALMAENDKCENAPLLLKTKSHNSVGSSHTSPRNQPQHQYLDNGPERVPVADRYRSTLKKKTLGLKTKKRSSLKTDQNESALVVGHNPFLPNNQGIGELASLPYVMNNKELNRKYLTSPQSIRKMDLVNQPLPKVMIGSSEYEPPPKTALPQEIVVPQAIISAYMRRPVSGNRLGPFENRLESRCWNSGLATRDMALDVDNIQQTEVEAKRAERDQNYDKFGVPKNYKFLIASKDDKISSQGDLNSASFMKDLSSQNSSQVDHKKSIDTSIGGGQSGLVSEQGSGAGKPFSNTYIENSVYSQESKLGSLLGLDDEDMEVQPTSTSLLEVEQWR
jgi:hypothetical protein